MLIVSEFGNLLNLRGSLRETSEYCANVSSLLHRDDSELIFFVDPHEECLLVVMEDASSFRPVTVKTTSLKEPISFLEQEVVSDELVLILRTHR